MEVLGSPSGGPRGYLRECETDSERGPSQGGLLLPVVATITFLNKKCLRQLAEAMLVLRTRT